MKRTLFLLILFVSIINSAFTQTKYTLSGYIKDEHGEDLIGASIVITNLNSVGVVSNTYGFYSITLPEKSYNIRVSYIGFKDTIISVSLNKNITLNVKLTASAKMLNEVNISTTRKDDNIQKVEMSTQKLQMKEIKRLPVLLGEVDIIKTIQLLPGVQTGVEGSSGFYVRGGNVDQNLILLDDATVYNASHAAGFFSVFSGDAIKDVQLYKGGIPAEYGGRLSSVLDVRMKDGNTEKIKFEGGIGLISSRLAIDGPILKDRCSFLLSGRRTYADLLLLMSGDSLVKDSKLYFYDLNTKINLKINDNNRIFLSGYFGKDVTGFSEMYRMEFGNATSTVRWNHLISSKLFLNSRFIYSDYYYRIYAQEGREKFDWKSHIIDYSLNSDLTWYASPSNTLKGGLSVIYHDFKPGLIEAEIYDDSQTNGSNEEPLVSYLKLEIPDNYALEYGGFIQDEFNLTEKLGVQVGLRVSVFQNISMKDSSKTYTYDKSDPEDYNVSDTIYHNKGEIYNTYWGLEPRLSIRYTINGLSSIKASYNRTYQYMHLATNTAATTPFDVWFPCSPNVKPQYADQVGLGYFRNFFDNKVEFSAEVYYKKMYSLIDYCDHANLFVNEQMEGEIRVGEGYSYGLELLVRKQVGRFTGWVGYTLSTSIRKIPEIENGDKYFSPYDRPHDLKIVFSYDLSKRLNVCATWVYMSAPPRTVPSKGYEQDNVWLGYYLGRNKVRIDPYHRLDLSANIELGSKGRSNINVSIYNVYNRHNAYSITFKQDEDSNYGASAYRMYLFGIVPSITYNFKF